MDAAGTTSGKADEHSEGAHAPLWQRIAAAPPVFDAARAAVETEELAGRAATSEALAPLGRALADKAVRGLLDAVFGASPYLTGLIRREPAWLQAALLEAPETRLEALIAGLESALTYGDTPGDTPAPDRSEVMAALRRFKSEVALLVALADIAGAWDARALMQALTRAGDATSGLAVRALLAEAAARGDFIPLDPARAETGSGYIVIAVGKYGAFELNYSSDIDLIVFFEPGLARLRDDLDPQAFFVRITRDLVRLLDERTGQGYVFRTDLRLRPDPGATQLALSTEAALHYYESFGQNWERAALIKARVVAGDVDAGARIMARLQPYIWRKYLDFAAIADIHAMKRQVHAVKGFGEIAVGGHNIKLGRGGIREIEFFAQTQQLIAGGRQPDLRVSGTLEALVRLEARGWISALARDELTDAYLFLRHVEHRLQMIADEQTHVLPIDKEKLERLARFAGFPGRGVFAIELKRQLRRVERHYAALFENVPELTRAAANLVFTGDADDPATVENLARMGLANPSRAIAAVRIWHFGRYPAMRSVRARERLTEVQPALLEALAETADPDRALASFDQFLRALPSGVQLFSLLRSNPALLRLIADIMGTAPRLARILSRRPRILEAVLDPGFFGSLPSEEALRERIDVEIASAHDYQECLDRTRVFGREQRFLIGVRILTDTISAEQAGGAYARLAEVVIRTLQAVVEEEQARIFGRMRDGAAAVIAMGKLGGREMTASSDLDLIVVYDFDPAHPLSDGERALEGARYYARLTRRLVSALTAPMAEGRLFDVDMRLRPSGHAGPVATHVASFESYQRREAWTWEHMALTRARAISGPPALARRIEKTIGEVLTMPRDREATAADVHAMRGKIEKKKGTIDIWDLKQVRGGLIDLEFIAQYLQLVHAPNHPEILDQNTHDALGRLGSAGVLGREHTEILVPAARLYHDLTQILRLCVEERFDSTKAPDGLKALLAKAGQVPNFARLEIELRARLAAVRRLSDVLIA